MSVATASTAAVTAAVVTYDSAAVVERCLESLATVERLVVVDNASRDGTRERIEAVRPDAEVIANRRNLGFGRACNQALDRAATEYVLLLNPDTVLWPGTIERLVEAAGRYSRAGVVAPRLVDDAGRWRPSHFFGLYPPRRRLEEFDPDRLPELLAALAPLEGDLCADFAVGAALLVRREAVDEVGGFDPRFFLYFEELDLCLRLREGGWEVVVAPAAVIEHVPGRSSPASLRLTWRRAWHGGWSHLYLVDKHCGGATARRVGARACARSLRRLGFLATRPGGRGAGEQLALLGGMAAFLLAPVSRGRARDTPAPEGS